MFSQVVDGRISPPRDDEMGITYILYPTLFVEGDVLTRKDVMDRAGRSYSTVVYHLERAVSAGLLHKQYGFSGEDNRPAWLYGLPETMPRLRGI